MRRMRSECSVTISSIAAIAVANALARSVYKIGRFVSNTKVGAMSPLTRAPERGIAADLCRLEARPYRYSGGEHAMDRTMFRDLEQTTALLFGELADKRDRHVDLLG